MRVLKLHQIQKEKGMTPLEFIRYWTKDGSQVTLKVTNINDAKKVLAFCKSNNMTCGNTNYYRAEERLMEMSEYNSSFFFHFGGRQIYCADYNVEGM